MNKYRFKFIWDDWGKSFFKFIVIMVALAMLGMLGYNVFKIIQNQSTVTEVKRLRQQNNKNFAVLNEQTLSTGAPNKYGDEYIVIDLYMKKPFMNSSDLNNALTNEVSEIKEKYNGSHDKKLRAIGIRIFDRKVVYDLGLTPRAIADYTLDDSVAEDLASNNNDNKNQEQMLGKKGLSQAQDAGYVQQETPASTMWSETLSNTKKIDYNDYSLNIYGFKTYNKEAVTHPLTDQEFAFWLKLKMYQKAIGGDDMASAIKLYLNYDLNGNVNQENFVAISEKFKELDDRETQLGDETNYFPNRFLLRQELAVYRPQLMYLILTGKSEKDYSEAQKKLLQTPQGKNYKKAIKKHLKQVANNTDKYGDPKYLYKDDPFVGTTGLNRGKKIPSLSNYPFSPNISEDNALFGLSGNATTNYGDN